MEKVLDWLENFGKTTGLKILEAIALFILCIIAVRIILKIVKSVLKKSKVEKITQSFLLSILKFALYIALVLIVMQHLGISTSWLVALLTAASLAIGLSLQNSLSNLANGIVIITTKPFHEGDFVNIGGVEGKVKNIKMLTTAIVTLDNKLIVIPNSAIVTNNVINYNILGKRRCDFTFDVAYETDVKQAEEIIRNVIEGNGKVYLDPKPFISLKFLQSSSIQFFANCWCDAEDYWDIYYYVTNTVFNEFKKANISIPFNQVEVRMRTDKVKMPVAKDMKIKRIEKVRTPKENKDFIREISESLKEKKLRLKNEQKAEKLKQQEEKKKKKSTTKKSKAKTVQSTSKTKENKTESRPTPKTIKKKSK